MITCIQTTAAEGQFHLNVLAQTSGESCFFVFLDRYVYIFGDVFGADVF